MEALLGRSLKQAFCNGYFSKDYDLDGATVEAVGHDYVVVRTQQGIPYFQYFHPAQWSEADILAQMHDWMSY